MTDIDDLQKQIEPLIDALSEIFSKHAGRISIAGISYGVLRYLALMTVFFEKDTEGFIQVQHDMFDAFIAEGREARVEGGLRGFNLH